MQTNTAFLHLLHSVQTQLRELGYRGIDSDSKYTGPTENMTADQHHEQDMKVQTIRKIVRYAHITQCKDDVSNIENELKSLRSTQCTLVLNLREVNKQIESAVQTLRNNLTENISKDLDSIDFLIDVHTKIRESFTHSYWFKLCAQSYNTLPSFILKHTPIKQDAANFTQVSATIDALKGRRTNIILEANAKLMADIDKDSAIQALRSDAFNLSLKINECNHQIDKLNAVHSGFEVTADRKADSIIKADNLALMVHRAQNIIGCVPEAIREHVVATIKRKSKCSRLLEAQIMSAPGPLEIVQIIESVGESKQCAHISSNSYHEQTFSTPASSSKKVKLNISIG